MVEDPGRVRGLVGWGSLRFAFCRRLLTGRGGALQRGARKALGFGLKRPVTATELGAAHKCQEFRKVDDNSDGKLSREELTALLRKVRRLPWGRSSLGFRACANHSLNPEVSEPKEHYRS